MEPKYNIGDKIFALIGGVLIYGPIQRIEICYEEKNISQEDAVSSKVPITYYYFDINGTVIRADNKMNNMLLCSTIEEVKKLINIV